MKAVVYVSNTGHTKQYAEMFGEKEGLPVYELKEANKLVDNNAEIIYFGWLLAKKIKGYKQAKKRYNIVAICAVGLGDTGSQIAEVKKANGIIDDTPLFTLQGGIDKSKLHGTNKFMINMLMKGLCFQKECNEDDEYMLKLLSDEKSYVNEENLSDVFAWHYDMS